MAPLSTDQLLIQRIRAGHPDAWEEFIARYEGRLLAFVESRTRDRAAAEDVVQETFLGFLTSLPHYDEHQRLESFLFSIAAHKLTDYLRRQGRRPTLGLAPWPDSRSGDVPDRARAPSSIARSGERRQWQEMALAQALAELIAGWKERGQWHRLACAELLFVRGMPNKEVARRLGITEQAVASQKFECLARLRAAVRQQDLPQELFPDLYETR